MTTSSLRTWSGVPSEIFLPWSRTMIRSEMSMTTPMSCSMRTTAVSDISTTSST